MPGWARPVRIFCSSPFRASMDLAILASAVFLMSAMVMTSLDGSERDNARRRSDVHQGALVLAHHHAPERAGLEDREHLDRQFLVAAQRKGGGVQHLQVLGDGLVETHAGITRGR